MKATNFSSQQPNPEWEVLTNIVAIPPATKFSIFKGKNCINPGQPQMTKSRKASGFSPESTTLTKAQSQTPSKSFSTFHLNFRTLNKAYEILIDEKSRFIYELYLNNPSQSEYSMQFEYYNHKYIENPQIPVTTVLFGIIVSISALQFVMRKQMYEKAIERIV